MLAPVIAQMRFTAYRVMIDNRRSNERQQRFSL